MKYDFELVLDDDNALSKIIRQIGRDSVVLEFGPAAGRMTKYLKEHLNCAVYIVEIDRESAAIASCYAQDTIVGDIEEYEWLDKWEDKKFDFMIFADVLEHLKNPQKVLEKTKRLLKENGRTVLSVPNIGHNSILIHLYNNIFNYTPVGLLDNTHIHFFAYNTLKYLCGQAGYVPVLEDAVYKNVGENEVTASYEQVSANMRRELKKRIYNNVYQFVFVLQKKEDVQQNGCPIEKKIIPYTKDYKFQIFVDRGCGWMEENSITIPIELDGRKKITVPFSDTRGILNVRIDPIDCEGGICLESIKLIRLNSEEIVLTDDFITTNAEFRIDSDCLFLTEDSNIYLHGIQWEDIVSIEVAFTFLDTADMGIKMLGKMRGNSRYEMEIADLGRRLKITEEENNVLKNEQKACRNQLAGQAAELAHCRDMIQELNAQTLFGFIKRKLRQQNGLSE